MRHKTFIRFLIPGLLALCTLSCTGSRTGGVCRVNLSDTSDSLTLERFSGKPSSTLVVDVEAGTPTVPFGLEDAVHVGIIHNPDSTKAALAYVFSLVPDSVDTLSSTALRYHFTTGRSGRLMLMSARSEGTIPEAVTMLDRRVRSGWNQKPTEKD